MTTKIPVKYIDTTKYVVTISADYDDFNNPRGWDNFGTMTCGHRRYTLGDVQLSYSDFTSWDDVKQSLIDDGATIILPLGLYDHSGITMYVGDKHDRWDGMHVGYISVTDDEIRANYQVKRITKKIRERAEELLRAEVKEYDMYLRGDVYHVTIETEHGKEVDSCGGLFGTDGVEEYIKQTIPGAEYDTVEDWT